MKISNILIMVLAAGALSAEDSPALDARIQMFVEQSRPAQVVVTQTPGVFKDQPGNQTGVGFRFMGELASAPGFYYELGGKLDSSSNFSSNSTIINLTDVKVTDNYWSLGAAYMFKAGPSGSLGLHLEARGETLSIQGQANYSGLPAPVQLNHSVSFLRPWVRASADYTFSTIGETRHPFVGVDGAYALTNTSQPLPNLLNVDNRMLQSLAPKFALACYVGMRF